MIILILLANVVVKYSVLDSMILIMDTTKSKLQLWTAKL